MGGKVHIVHLLRAKTQEMKSCVKCGLDYVERIGRKIRPERKYNVTVNRITEDFCLGIMSNTLFSKIFFTKTGVFSSEQGL